MNDSTDRLFDGGQPNPEMAGIPLRGDVAGEEPAADRISEAARLLGRPVQFVDSEGFEQEIISATPVRSDGALAYVTTSAKDVGPYIDITIRFHVRDARSQDVSSSIESYNPYFGCDVRYLEWMGSTAVLIYREKHNTYVSACDGVGAPQYVKIADSWVLNGSVLGYWKYKATEVQRIKLPLLEPMEAISEAAAVASEVCPPKHW